MSEADRTRGVVGPEGLQATGPTLQNVPSIDPVLVDDEEDEAILPGMWMEGDSLAPPCQSEMVLVPQVISMAGITAEDVFWDLGCGDGRICRAVTKLTGCRSNGVEIEPHLASKFRDRITSDGLEGRVTAWEGDLRDVRFDEMMEDTNKEEVETGGATQEEGPSVGRPRTHGGVVVYIYLLPEGVASIADRLEAMLHRGCRIVCNTWGLATLAPAERRAAGHLNNTTLLLYDRRSLPTGGEKLEQGAK